MRRSRWSSALVAAGTALAAASVANAAPGDLDPTFGQNGKTYLAAYASGDLAVQPDGATVVVGDEFIARVNPDGALDNAFGKQGFVAKPFNATSSDPAAVAIQPDGRIVVAGTVTAQSPPFEDDIAIARYLPDGTPDPTLSGDGVALLSTAGGDVGERAEDVAIQADGRILVAGTSGANGLIARFNADGTPDPAFSGDGFLALPFGFPGATLEAVAPGPAGSVYAAGAALKGTDDSDMLAVRVDSAGNPAPGFDADGIRAVDFGAKDGATELAVQADGNLVLGGTTRTRSAFARLTPSGADDPAFNGDGRTSIAPLTYVGGLGLGADGTIYAVGGGGVDVLRLTPAGEPDSAFSGNGIASISLGGAFAVSGEALAVAPDGRVMVSGSAVLSKDDSVVGLARLRVDAAPPDADADGVGDGDDACILQAGTLEHDGCPLVKRKLTLKDQKGFFHGKVSVSAPGTELVSVAYRRCLFDGKVTIYRVERGADKKVGSTGAGSAWTVKEKIGNGDYYARLKPHVYEGTELCGKAKSKVLHG